MRSRPAKSRRRMAWGQGVTLVDGDGVWGDTVARVQHDTGGTTRGVQGQHGLDGHVHGGGVEGLEHDLGHLLTVGLGVEGGLCEQDGCAPRGPHAARCRKGVVPRSSPLSSQLVTMPCSMGYFRVRIPRLL